MSALAIYAQAHHEAAQYHNPRRHGFVSLCYSTPSGRRSAARAFEALEVGPPNGLAESQIALWRAAHECARGHGFAQRSFKVAALPSVLERLREQLPLNDEDAWEGTSVWLSQAEFSRPNRRKLNFESVAVCWVDLDLRHENSPACLSRLGPDEALQKVLSRCASEALPLPSMVLWTGRGLAVKWYTETLPRQAYPRWAAVQSALVDVFAGLGADGAARDASRILRVAGTFNPKSGTKCTPIYVRESWGEVERVAFDGLANAILPFTREQLAQRREQQAAQRVALKHRLVALDGGGQGQTANLLTFNPVRLAWLQVSDYRTLASLRPVASRPEGWTNQLVMYASSALAIAVWADAAQWGTEIPALVRELAPHWSASRIATATSSVVARMARMARGEWVEWKSRKVPPVYTPKHATIIRDLGITEQSMLKLAVIIDRDTARERARVRDQERKTTSRRAAGVRARGEYLAAAQDCATRAQALRCEGLPVDAIAARLNVSRRQVYRWLALKPSV